MSDRYECDGCGACCRTKMVDVYEVDLLREPRLGEEMQPLREPGWDGEVGYLSCLAGGGCPFLDGENRCVIYLTRPSVCVVFAPGDDECQEARQTLGIPVLDPAATKPTVC